MKKNLLIQAALFLCAISAYGQVGINTENPQGTFHIDGGKDNPTTGAPDATQQKNDFLVTSAGRVGVRTVMPNSSLGINGSVSYAVRQVSNDSPVIVTEDDQTIVINGSGTEPKGIRLPAASTCLGRTYTIINLSGSKMSYIGTPQMLNVVGLLSVIGIDKIIEPYSVEIIQAINSEITGAPDWIKITGPNLYTKDGRINGSRNVSMLAGNSLRFYDSSTNETLFSIISGGGSMNDRVGVGTVAPTERLDVDGAVKIGNSSTYTGISHGATTPIPNGGAGTIIFDGTGFFGWNGTSWHKLDN